MILEVDRAVYSDVCISKTIYAFSDRYTFVRSFKNGFEVIEVIGELTDETAFKRVFFDSLNDYKLRCIIDEQTKDIRTLLYAKTFMNSEDEE